jgi:hypothetical protein
MLTIRLEEQEFFNSEEEIFLYTKPTTIRMEHSLISLSKWEANWEKSYLSSASQLNGLRMTRDEELDYIQCMIIGGDTETYILETLRQQHHKTINDYINKPYTATKIHRVGPQQSPPRQTITSEIIYFWMINYGIPFDPTERWHLNRLLMLIDVCNVKTSSGKEGKLSNREALQHMNRLNKARRSG